jgi:hypothetical protein
MAETRFPRYDLDSSIEVARQIHQRGAGGIASANELAEFLDYSGANNGAFLYRASAARMFGLIDGQSPTIRVSPLALDILRPAHPDAAQRARMTAFQAVPLYRKFLEDYEGQTLPDAGLLQNALTRRGVPEKDAPVALARMMDSAEQAGLFRIAGNRSKMIRPTISEAKAQPETASETVERTATDALPITESVSVAVDRFPKIIEGALDSLPSERQWDEEEFTEWLDFFERALRVHYRLPRRRREA